MTEEWTIFHILAPGSPLQDEALGNCLSRFPHCGYYEGGRQGDLAEWHVYFEPGPAPTGFAEEFARAAADFGFNGSSIRGPFPAPRENWHDAWRQYFRPVEVTPNILIVPSWEQHLAEAHEKAGKTVLRIEPGMAFGTGTHATTQLCLALAEKTIHPGDHVLDAGTGSAILAIVAAKLGAAYVLGFDLDPDIEENAALNLELNRVSPSAVDVRVAPLESLGALEPFNVIFCNMLSHEFLPILPGLSRLLKPGTGRLILSGMLTDEADGIQKAIAQDPPGLKTVETAVSGEWTAFVTARESA